MTNKNPPKWPIQIIRFFCNEKYQEQIEGDVYELFERDQSTFNFIKNTFGFLRWRYLKNLEDFENLTTLAMIKNYLKIGIRNLTKYKSYSAINISGLAIALSCFMLISMYVLHERSYDQFLSPNIYRVANGDHGSWTPFMLAETAEKEVPQVAFAATVNGLDEALIKVNNQSIKEKNGAWVGPNFLEVFELDLLKGNKTTALKEPDNVILTESIAKKYFPNGNQLGEIMEIEGGKYTVTGVIADPPKNTHLPYAYLVANHRDKDFTYHWSGNNTFTYTRLKKEASASEAIVQFEDLYEKYVAEPVIAYTGHASFEALKADYPERNFAFTLTPIQKIHLEKPYFSLGSAGNKDNILTFSIIALFILLIASINYINMATARSAIRSKEVGIRRSLGSNRKGIILQFLIESIMITVLAILVAFIISTILLPVFNKLTLRFFEIQELFSLKNIGVSMVLILVVGILAGSYPAYITSKFNPISALKGSIKSNSKSIFRSSLVVFQFSTSVFLIAITFIAYQQIKHLQTQDIGIKTEQTLVIENGMVLGNKYEVFAEKLKALPSVGTVGKMSHVPFYRLPDYTYKVPEVEEKTVSPLNTFMEQGVEDILGLELLDGRFFKKDFVSDTASVIINEALASELGWEDPLGHILQRGDLKFKVIGVIKDFHFESLKFKIYPLIIRYGSPSMEIREYHQRYILLSMKNNDPQQLMNRVSEEWEKIVPEYPFEARFLDDSFQRVFESEKRFAQTFTAFSSLAVVIALMGLFALTTFMLQRKYKELAIRKVMGASVSSLVQMIVKEFTWLVLIGGIIGLSGAYYWIQDWIADYNNRVEIGWQLLAPPLLLVVLLTWLIVSSRSYGAAIANPSNALKDE